MIICICEGITERTLRTSIQEGAATLSELVIVSGAGQDCGRCRVSLRALLHDSACRPERDSAEARQPCRTSRAVLQA